MSFECQENKADAIAIFIKKIPQNAKKNKSSVKSSWWSKSSVKMLGKFCSKSLAKVGLKLGLNM